MTIYSGISIIFPLNTVIFDRYVTYVRHYQRVSWTLLNFAVTIEALAIHHAAHCGAPALEALLARGFAVDHRPPLSRFLNSQDMGVSINGGTPQDRWFLYVFVMENPIKMGWFRGRCLQSRWSTGPTSPAPCTWWPWSKNAVGGQSNGEWRLELKSRWISNLHSSFQESQLVSTCLNMSQHVSTCLNKRSKRL